MEKDELTSLQMVTVRWWNASAYYAISLAEALRREEVPVMVSSPEHYPAYQKAKERRLPVLAMPTESVSPIRVARNLRKLRRIIQENKIHILNAHRPEDHAHAALLRGVLRYPVPVVRTVTDVRFPKTHPINYRIHKEWTDYLIFSSQSSAKRYESVWPFLKSEKNYMVIHAAIDTDYFKPRTRASTLRQELGIGEKEIVFGLIARFSPVKGHRYFLEAASRVVKNGGNARFIISGEEVEITLKDLQTQAAKLGISQKVIFLPRQKDVREVIAALDVGVVTSVDSEVVCRIGLEMMAMGVPIIATRVNVLPEMVKDQLEGILVPPQDSLAIARAMEQLLKRPGLCYQMGKAARKRVVQDFSYPTFVSNTMVAYRQAMFNFKQKQQR